jgi:hypothetical protein
MNDNALEKNMETSDLNPSVICTSKSKNNWQQIDFEANGAQIWTLRLELL